MAQPTKIQHPLLAFPGSSQRRRVAEAFALKPDSALIDNRSMADILSYIHEYARQVVFHNYSTDEDGNGYAELSDWLAFFENSLPFQLVQFSRINFDQLEEDFRNMTGYISEQPSGDNLKVLLDFFYNELITPVQDLQKLVLEYDFALAPELDRTIRNALAPILKRFLLLSNASGKYLCAGNRDFSAFQSAPWNFSSEIFYESEDLSGIPDGEYGAILQVNKEAGKMAFQMLAVLRSISLSIPGHLEESLTAVQSRHEPHIGLLFAFIRIFRYFQGDINNLTQKHLDFFYKNVLKIKPKSLVADKAYLVFEIANHLNSFPISKDTQFKDGKDANGIDILFGLDDEIVIDKAQVKSLKTLYLNHRKNCIKDDNLKGDFLEGVYIAPKADSADGISEKFKETQAKNWSTLGAKPSKFTPPGKEFSQDHPFSRLGLVLASPVLWLNEGTRKIKIVIDCEDGGNKHIFTQCFQQYHAALTKPYYQITDQTILKIENLFSPAAKAYIENKLETQEPIIKKLRGEDLTINLTALNIFTTEEISLLKVLLDEQVTGEVYVLHEMPFASLLTYFNQIRVLQNPYHIGFDPAAFFATKDPVSCKPLLKDQETIDTITKLLKISVGQNTLFSLQFTGTEGWFTPKTSPTLQIDLADPNVKLTFDIQLAPDEPAVVFYKPEAIKETFKVECPFPQVKLELNPAMKVDCDICDPMIKECCLEYPVDKDAVHIALYQFFRHLTIKDTNIDVEVCGVKKLIVQNDESLQDVNSPILPFGSQPKVGEKFYINGGSNFYIGSKEVFCKNWNQFWINIKWKNKPLDLKKYYKTYKHQFTKFEDDSEEILESSFRFLTSVLEDKNWESDNTNNVNPIIPPTGVVQPNELFHLFGNNFTLPNSCSYPSSDKSTFSHQMDRAYFPGIYYKPKTLCNSDFSPLDLDTKKGFIKMTLAGVSFQHDKYAFVLARHLLAIANLVDPGSISQAFGVLTEIEDLGNTIKTKIGTVSTAIDNLKTDISNCLDPVSLIDLTNFIPPLPLSTDNLITLIGELQNAVANSDLTNLDAYLTEISKRCTELNTILNGINNTFFITPTTIQSILDDGTIVAPLVIAPYDLINNGLKQLIQHLCNRVAKVKTILHVDDNLKNGLPLEPYTPIIQSISIDYTAKAKIDDIEIIHLHPFANTSKTEYIDLKPTLLPTFTDEGTLFIGLEKVQPGANLQLLFQFAEATADSEYDHADTHWHYLTGNRWQPLRTGFEILSDKTDRLTRSGIVKIALPTDISNIGNTIMPPDEEGQHLYWIKVAAPTSVAAVAEVIGIHTQSALAVYQPLPKSAGNRVGVPLEPEQISKPVQPNFSIKKTAQPYASFGGKLAEEDGHLYTRVSELLRHKGRSVDAFDIEHLVLEAFPMLFKCKCISHTFGLSANDYRRDLEVAPGFIVVAVVPDLTKLSAGDVPEPKVPTSILSDIKAFLIKNTSPFARIKVMNPRYEKVNVELTVRLQEGRDENFYSNQLKTDLRHFLAPWYLGDSDKLSFGQHIRYSDVLVFVENLPYVDFITDLALINAADPSHTKLTEIVPLTARSILTGGEICITLNHKNCNDLLPGKKIEEIADRNCGITYSFLSE